MKRRRYDFTPWELAASIALAYGRANPNFIRMSSHVFFRTQT